MAMAVLLDRLNASLPPKECTCTKSEVLIPVLDGISLAADLYQPSGLSPGAKPHGLILVLGCYGREGLMAALNTTIFATRGYTV
jgi:predicted acyl esterase